MKHFAPPVTHVATSTPVVSKRRLLEDRKRGLERMVSARLAAARRGCTTADVRELSAALRKVKAEIAKLQGGGGANP